MDQLPAEVRAANMQKALEQLKAFNRAATQPTPSEPSPARRSNVTQIKTQLNLAYLQKQQIKRNHPSQGTRT